MRTRCAMDMRLYPFDTQTCSISLGTWMYPRYLVDMVPYDPFVYKNDYSNSLWRFKKVDFTSNYLYDNWFVYIEYSYTFERKSLYYQVNFIAPIILLYVATMATFWMPADCGEKASIVITILLAFSVYALIILEHTPKTSDVIPDISKYHIYLGYCWETIKFARTSDNLFAVAITLHLIIRLKTPSPLKIIAIPNNKRNCCSPLYYTFRVNTTDITHYSV